MVALLLAFIASVAAAEDVTDAVRKRIFVPADQLETVLEGRSGGVLLPDAEFRELVAAARTNAANAPLTSAGIVITSADYDAAIDGDRLRIEATLSFTQLRDGWQSLALNGTGLAIEEATIGDRPATLGRAPKRVDSFVLFHDELGDYELKLRTSAPITTVGSDLVTAFQLPSEAPGTLSLTVPAGKDLHVDGVRLERPAADDEPAEYTVAAGRSESLRLTITDRRAAPSADALLFARTAIGLHVSPGEITWRSVTSLSSFGRELDTLVFELPTTLEVAEVDAPGLESWRLEQPADDPETTLLTLEFRQPFEGSRRIDVRGVMTVRAGERWAVPNLVLRGATSHVGHVDLYVPDGVRLETVATEGVRPVKRDEASAEPRAAGETPAQSFDVWQERFELAFVTTLEPRSFHADLSTVLAVLDDRLDLTAVATIRGRFGQVFELDVAIPAAWQITAARVAGNEASWRTIPREAGTNLVRIALPQPLNPGETTTVTLEASRPLPERDGESVEVPLPELRLSAATLEARYTVLYPDWFDVEPVELSGLDPAPDSGGSANVPTPDGAELRRLSFVYQDGRIAGTLRITPEPPRTSVLSLVFARLDREALRTHVESELTVTGGGLREWTVALPEALGERLRFQVVRRDASDVDAQIVEQTPGEPADGRLPWRLRFDRRVRGRLRIAVSGEVPREDAESFHVPVPEMPDAERQHGYVALEAGGRQRVAITATNAEGEPLWEVDPVELPSAVAYAPRERIAAAFRFVRPNPRVVLSETRYDRVPVPTVVCSSQRLTSNVGRDGTVQHEVESTVRAVGVQSLGLAMPEGARIWSILVDGAPVELRRRAGAYAIPLVEAGGGSARVLSLVYSTRAEPLEESGRLRQAPPLFLVDAVDGWAAVETLEREWTVRYPDGLAYVGSDGTFRAVDDPDATTWFHRLQRLLTRFRTNELPMRVAVLIVFAAVVFLIAVAARRWGKWGVQLAAVAAVIVVSVALVGAALVLALQWDEAAQYAAESRSAAEVGEAASDGYGDFKVDFDFDEQEEVPSGEPRPDDAAPGSKQQPPPETPPSQPSFDDPFASQPNAAPERMPDDPDRDGVPEDLLDELEAQQRITTEGVNEADGRFDNRGGARLSVAVGLETTGDQRQTSFRYVGTDGDGATLDVRFRDRSELAIRRWFLALAIAAVMWSVRNAGLGRRALVAAITLAVPLGLAAVAPAGWQSVLQGMFLGGCLGLGLWLVAAIPRCCGRRATAAMVIAAVALVGTRSASAQPQRAAPAMEATAKPEPPAEAVPVPTADFVIVPYEEGTDPLEATKVFVPRATFVTLWNAAHPDRPLDPERPFEAIVVSADYDAELVTDDDAKSARVAVDATFAVQTFGEEPVSVVVPTGEAATRSIALDGEPAAVEVGDDGVPRVRVPEAGRHTLAASFAVPAKLTGPAGRFEIELANAPAGRLRFALPRDDVSVRVNGAADTYRRVEDDAAAIVVPVTGGGTTTVEWFPDSDRADDEAIVHVEGTTQLEIGDAGLAVVGDFTFRVRRGSIGEVTFAVPEPLRIRRIAGPGVGGWSVDGDGANREVTVFLRRNVDDETRLTIETFAATELDADGTEIPLPELRPRNVTRETGTVGVMAEPQFLVTPVNVDGLNRVAASEYAPVTTPDGSPPPLQLAFRYARRPFSATFRVSRRPASLKVDAQHWLRVQRHDVRLESLIDVDPGGTARRRFVLRLPPEFVTLLVRADDLEDWYVVERGEGGRELVVEFAAPRTEPVTVGVQGKIPRREDDERLELRVPELAESERADTKLAVFAPESLRVTLESLGDWRRTTVDRLPDRMRHRGPESPKFALTTEAPAPQPAVLGVRRAIPRWTGGDALHLATVDDDKVSSVFAVQWIFDGAAADRFAFTLPESYAGRLEFEDELLRRVERVAIDGGRTRWIVHGKSPVRNGFLVVARAVSPPPGGELQAPVPIVEVPTEAGEFREVEPQRRYVVAVNWSRYRLELANEAELESVQPRDVTFLGDGEQYRAELSRATTIARLAGTGVVPTWDLTRLDRQRGESASVNLQELLTVFATDGTWRGSATYHLRNRGRQFLALTFPEGLRPLSALVDGRPAPIAASTIGERAPEAGEDHAAESPGEVWLVPIPLVSRHQPPAEVRVVYAPEAGVGSLTRAFGILERTIAPPAPSVVSPRESPEFGIPVARTVWTVLLPDELTARPLDDPSRNTFSMTERDSLDELKVDLRSSARQPVEEGYWKQVEELSEQLGRRSSGTAAITDGTAPSHRFEELRELQQKDLSERLWLGNSAIIEFEKPAADAGTIVLDAPMNEEATKPGEGEPGTGKRGEGKSAPASRTQRQELAQQQAQTIEQNYADEFARENAQPRSGLGGIGGLGGGMGGLPAPGPAPNARASQLGLEARQPTGVLSLDVELPRAGRVFTFTKAGGEPTLAFLVRSDELTEHGPGLVWAIVWVGLGLVVVLAALFGRTRRGVERVLPAGLLIGGAVAFLLLPEGLALAGLALFASGALWTAVRFARDGRGRRAVG